MANLTSIVIDDTGGIVLPVGTAANRPSTTTSVVSFTSVGSTTWTCPANVFSVEVLVVAGGGGGSYTGSGGGAGGVLYRNNYPVTPSTSYTVTVGSGGTAGPGAVGGDGGNSIFDSLIAIGGGGGTTHGTSNGRTGGSGSGAPQIYTAGAVNAAGEGTLGQGHRGGTTARGVNDWPGGSAGGGGAGGSPRAHPDNFGAFNSDITGGVNIKGYGYGGHGIASGISNTISWYAGGGGGGEVSFSHVAYGGRGGGGQGGTNATGTAGSTNTGGGGGGGGYDGGYYGGGNGGSGIVILRYTTQDPVAQSRFNSTVGRVEVFNNTWNSQKIGEYSYKNGLLLDLDAENYVSGSTWDDQGGAGASCTINGASFSSSGIKRFTFTAGNPGSTVTVPLSTSFNKLSGTINIWVYPTTYDSSNGWFVNRSDSTSNALDWLWIGTWSSGNVLYFRLGDGTNCCNQDLTISNFSSRFPLNQWHNFTFSWESGKFARIYYNGELITSREITTIPNTNPSTEGRIGLGHASGSTGSLAGSIARFQIWGRELSDKEIEQTYNAQAPRYAKVPPMINVGAAAPGSTAATAAVSARQIKELTGTTKNGFYWLRPGNLTPIYVWCDMNYSGGGWTLVMCNCKAGAAPGAPAANGIGGLSYYQVVNNNNINGSYNSDMQFRQFVGLKYWPHLGLNIAQFCSASFVTLSATANHTKRYRWSYTGFNSTYGFLGAAAVSDETGTGAPGMYTYHALNSYSMTTYDLDQDVSSSNCAAAYGNNPFWYGSCWSGNMWGGGNSGGYQDGPFWESSGGDYHNYMAIYLKV